jgi:outer membrane receptor protein involved in Fe transport
VVASLSYGTAAYADSVIVGQVVSADGKAPVSDVVVTATSPNLQGEQVVVTDAQGQYRIPQLPPGVYTLRFDKESFKPFSRPEIQLRLDRTIRVNVEMLPEAFQTTIDVVARPPTIDVGSTSQGVNVDQDFIKRIAVNRPGGKSGAARSFESLAELAPGAQNDNYGVSINGTTSPENGYVVDGLSTNDPAFGVNASPLSVEFVQDVNIITGGYMPEYGRSTGGVINAVTKSGSNEFHGTVFANMTPGALEGQRVLVRDAASVIGRDITVGNMGDLGATLGGPIMKDKLWFFAGIAPALTRYKAVRTLNALTEDEAGELVATPIPGAARNYFADSRSFQYMGKLTYLVNSDHNLSVSLTGTPTTTGGNGRLRLDPQTGTPLTGFDANPSAIGQLVDTAGTTAVGLKYAGSFMEKKFLVDANLGWFHQTASSLPRDGSELGSKEGMAGISRIRYRTRKDIGSYEPEVGALADYERLCGGAPGSAAAAAACPAPIGGYDLMGPGFISNSLLDRYQINAKGTYLLDLFGSHVIKAGADVEMLSYQQLKAFSGGVFYRQSGANWVDFRRYGYQTGPDTAVYEDLQRARTSSTTVGGFLQDSWTVGNRLTLNLGVRYDTQSLFGGDGNLALVLPNQISPRLGVIVDPLANGRMKLYANFSRYYEQVPLNLADRAFPGERRVQAVRLGSKCDPSTVEGQRGGCADASSIRNTFPADGLNPNFQNIGGKVENEPVDPNIQPQSSDEFMLGAEYELLANTRLGVTYTHRDINSVIEDMSRDNGNTYFLGNPGEGFAKDFKPNPSRNYDAVNVFLNRTFADGWLAQASYTWSRLYGNYPGLFKPETLQLDPNILADFDIPSLLPNRVGLLPFDRTHAIKLFGAKEFNFTKDLSTSLGLSYRGNSGTPLNYFGGHPLYGDDEAFVLPRGTGGRTPWVNNIDSNIGVNYRVTKTSTVSFTLDVFNIFNFQGVTAQDQTYTYDAVLPVVDGTPADLPGNVVVVDESGEPLLDEAGNRVAVTENPNFRKPTQYQAPRQVRFGIRYTF